MKRESPLRVNDIKEYVEKILKRTKDISEDEFYNDEILQSAVMRWLEIIGEAAKYVDVDTKQLYPEIPWKEMAAFRDVAIHDYADILYKRVWQTIREDIPRLKELLEQIETRL